ncbi:MAG: AraC family transcriptional regulator [Defluviitaleaceae bacterium]|nr:AraC family transcriptional regulator [Defluviitaleaceae bacterium]
MLRIKQKPVLHKYITSACLFILALLAMFAISTSVLLRTLNQSFHEHTGLLVENAISYLEDRMLLHATIAITVSTDESIRNLSFLDAATNNPSFLPRAQAATQYLRNLRVTNDAIADILVVYDNIPISVTSNGTWSTSYLSYWEASFGASLHIMESSARSGFFSSGAYLVTYNNYFNNIHVFVVAYQAVLETMLNRIVPNDYGTFVALDKDSAIMLSSAHPPTGQQPDIIIQRQGLTHHFYYNQAAYLNTFNSMMFMSIGIVIGIVGLAVFMLYRIKKALYDPLPQIIKMLDASDDNMDTPALNQDDEFTQIHGAIGRMHINLVESNNALRIMGNNNRQFAFTQLITAEATEEIKACIDLGSRHFCALTILFEDDDGNKDAARTRAFASDSAIFDRYRVYGISKYSVYYFFLKNEDEYQQLADWVSKYQEQSGFSLCGVSNLHTSMDEIATALEESQQAFFAIPIVGLSIQKRLAVFNSSDTVAGSGCKISVAHHNQLIAAAIGWDINSTEAIMLDMLYSNEAASVLEKRQLLLYLYDTICMLVGGTTHLKRSFLENIYNPELLLAKTLSDLSEQAQLAEGNDDMLMWLEDNLHKDISLSDLATSMGVSYSHASRFFTHKTGTNFSEYLQKKRVERAMTLLLETSKSIEEISNATGFMSINTFFRVFKKNAGMPPGKYREIGQSNDSEPKPPQ